MITEQIAIYANHLATEQMSQCVPKIDERFSRDMQADFLAILSNWFEFIKSIKNGDFHPQSLTMFLRFLGQDLGGRSNML